MRPFGAHRLFVMINFMFRFLFIYIFFILAIPAVTLAYNPQINEAAIPYEIKTINEVNLQAEHLGELKGDPHIYEFTIDKTTDLKVMLMQLASDKVIPLSLIIVRQNEDRSGVSEIGRINGNDTNWQIVKDSVLGLTINKSEVFEEKLKPGVYRVEVSTPDNYGKYALVIGNQTVKEGYFSTLSDVSIFQTFFGGSMFSILKSSYVHYPLGIVIVIVVFYLTWRNSNKVKGVKHA